MKKIVILISVVLALSFISSYVAYRAGRISLFNEYYNLLKPEGQAIRLENVDVTGQMVKLKDIYVIALLPDSFKVSTIPKPVSDGCNICHY